MVFKHGYSKDDPIVRKLILLASKNNIDIKDQDLDLIIGKYYVDFFLDKTEEMNIGYTDSERNNIRTYVRSLVYDVTNKNFSKNIIK